MDSGNAIATSDVQHTTILNFPCNYKSIYIALFRNLIVLSTFGGKKLSSLLYWFGKIQKLTTILVQKLEFFSFCLWVTYCANKYLRSQSIYT